MMGPFSPSPKPKQPFLLKNTRVRDLFGDENFHFQLCAFLHYHMIVSHFLCIHCREDGWIRKQKMKNKNMIALGFHQIRLREFSEGLSTLPIQAQCKIWKPVELLCQQKLFKMYAELSQKFCQGAAFLVNIGTYHTDNRPSVCSLAMLLKNVTILKFQNFKRQKQKMNYFE